MEEIKIEEKIEEKTILNEKLKEFENAINTRKFKEKLTVGMMKAIKKDPFDLFNVEERLPQIKNHPLKLTWDTLVPLHNIATGDGIQITDDTPFFIAFGYIVALMESGFLG